MQGIQCLKGCGASIEDIQEYCRLYLLEESEENLRARYVIILKQREEAYKRLEEVKATVKYMDEKAAHYMRLSSAGAAGQRQAAAADDGEKAKGNSGRDPLP